MTADLPDLLTVEEAALLLRIGRTKAYALTREWRATDGRAGLPVVDFGHVLRVPRHALERLIGGPLTGSVTAVPGEARGDEVAPGAGPTVAAEVSPDRSAAGPTPIDHPTIKSIAKYRARSSQPALFSSLTKH